ncbi:hypothetical protein OROMI_001233 [Orobanche minor]
MASSDFFKGVNLRAVKEQIIFSIVVDFESLLQTHFTEDMKLIVRSMKRNGIYNFLNIDPQHLYKEAVISFYQEAVVAEEGIRSSVFGEDVCITPQTIAEAFNMKNRGLPVEALKLDLEFLWGLIRTYDAPGKIKLTAKKALLKPEYGLVMAMTNKIVMGMAGGFDQLSSVKFPVFGAMLQNSRVNWPEYIYRQIAKEVNKADWDPIQGKFAQKLAYGTQLSWILKFLGKAGGKKETFVVSKRLGHIGGDKTQAIQFIAETRSDTPSRQYNGPSDSEETRSDTTCWSSRFLLGLVIKMNILIFSVRCVLPSSISSMCSV